MESQGAIDGSGGDPGNDEFMQALYRGGELLTEGKVIEAKEHLERAVKLRPENEKCQNLLGLTYFKLGVFDRAADIYGGLVKANPADPTLRVNLGLVYLKTNFLGRAVREFETAIDLAPEHTKAHNYLGLALAQAGDYKNARDHFLAAGSELMAERMARALAGGYGTEGAEQAPSAPASPPPSPPPSESSDDSAMATIDGLGAERQAMAEDEVTQPYFAQQPSPEASAETPGAQETDWGAQLDAQAAEPATAQVSPDSLYAVEQMPAADGPVDEGYELAAPEATPILPTPILRDLASSIQILREQPTAVFQVDSGQVVMSVNGQMLTRLSGLVVSCGSLAFGPERKRFRDRTTDRWFGEGPMRMARVQGQGTLYFQSEGRIFTPVELDGESAYFREDRVFALEDSLSFENGRLPAPFATDLDLVHLRGKGSVLLGLDGALHSVEVIVTRPVVLPVERLVGWQGHLTPRISALLPDDNGKHRAGLELSGEGFALLTVPLR